MNPRIQPLLLVSIIAAVGLATCQRVSDRPIQAIESTPLSDSLAATFATMKADVRENRFDSFYHKLDPTKHALLKVEAKQKGFQSLESMLRRRAYHWPDPDNLILHDLRQSGNYVRLGYARCWKPNRSSGERIKYSFLLFVLSEQEWKLADMTRLEMERLDRYGYLTTYHETDLPSLFRFPRIF